MPDILEPCAANLNSFEVKLGVVFRFFKFQLQFVEFKQTRDVILESRRLVKLKNFLLKLRPYFLLVKDQNVGF